MKIVVLVSKSNLRCKSYKRSRWRSFLQFKWSLALPIMLTIEPTMVSAIQTYNSFGICSYYKPCHTMTILQMRWHSKIETNGDFPTTQPSSSPTLNPSFRTSQLEDLEKMAQRYICSATSLGLPLKCMRLQKDCVNSRSMYLSTFLMSSCHSNKQWTIVGFHPMLKHPMLSHDLYIFGLGGNRNASHNSL